MTNDFQLIDGTLTFAPGTQYVKSQGFSQRDDIFRVVLPEGLGFMEDEAFVECPNLKEVILPEGLVNIGVAVFANCTALESINIPSSVRNIEDGAFLFCEGLRHIKLPEGLEEIAQLSFQGSGLESVSVPSTVKNIGEEAFFECPNLRHADVLGADTCIGLNAFGCNYLLTEGFIAPGYSIDNSPPAELLYTLLWCSCPERHSPEVCLRAESFIKANEELIMERILKANNIAAMSGLAKRGLLSAQAIEKHLKETLSAGQTELSALLLEAKRAAAPAEGEFDL